MPDTVLDHEVQCNGLKGMGPHLVSCVHQGTGDVGSGPGAVLGGCMYTFMLNCA